MVRVLLTNAAKYVSLVVLSLVGCFGKLEIYHLIAPCYVVEDNAGLVALGPAKGTL